MDHAPPNPDPLLNRKQAARYCGDFSPATFEVYASKGIGPQFIKFGPNGRVFYRQSSLDAWIADQMVCNGKAPCPHCGGAL